MKDELILTTLLEPLVLPLPLAEEGRHLQGSTILICIRVHHGMQDESKLTTLPERLVLPLPSAEGGRHLQQGNILSTY